MIVETRSLEVFNAEGQLMLPQRWQWQHRRTIDRVLRRRPRATSASLAKTMPFHRGEAGCGEGERLDVYAKWRGNMPVLSIVPSTVEGQEYEVVVKIAPHKRRDDDVPVSVVWSAGPNFPLVRCEHSSNPEFSARLHYYGGMLVQARMSFAKEGRDGSKVSDAYVYAPFPP